MSNTKTKCISKSGNAHPTGYDSCSDADIADMLERELEMHMMNDTAAREKVYVAIGRLRAQGNPDKRLENENKRLTAQINKLNKKLDRVRSILES